MSRFNVKFRSTPSFNISFNDNSRLRTVFSNVVEVSDKDAYDGEYIITPTQEKQILNTKDKLCVDNIVVQPIPQNYGRIAYNGYSLTVT